MTIFKLTLNNLSETLPDLRVRFGLTQMETAEGIGISFQAYNPIELGKSTPRHETFEKIKKFFEEMEAVKRPSAKIPLNVDINMPILKVMEIGEAAANGYAIASGWPADHRPNTQLLIEDGRVYANVSSGSPVNWK